MQNNLNVCCNSYRNNQTLKITLIHILCDTFLRQTMDNFKRVFSFLSSQLLLCTFVSTVGSLVLQLLLVLQHLFSCLNKSEKHYKA